MHSGCARRRKPQSCKNVKQGGFSGAVGTNEAEQLVFLYVQMDVVERLNAPKMPAEIFDLNQVEGPLGLGGRNKNHFAGHADFNGAVIGRLDFDGIDKIDAHFFGLNNFGCKFCFVGNPGNDAIIGFI